jgi:hypothetical protein
LAPEPVEQIGHLQEILADVEEDFQPAGSIRPEIELRFDEPEHPFGEKFAEEEVIADRYAPAAETPTPGQPATKQVAAPRRSAATPCQAEVAEAVDDSHPETVPMHRQSQVAEPEDDDMIVVEEGYEDTRSWPRRSIVPVRKQEYGRLFAKLRHTP